MRPALDGDHAVAGIDADRDPLREGFRGLFHKGGIADSSGSQDHPPDTGLEPGFDACGIANAAAQLNRHCDRLQNRADCRGVDRPSGESAIQIHHMQPFEARGLEGSGLGGRVLVEDGRLRHVALTQAHAASVLQIDGGKEDHAVLTAAI